MVILKNNFLRPRRYGIASDLSIFNFDISLFITIRSFDVLRSFKVQCLGILNILDT